MIWVYNIFVYKEMNKNEKWHKHIQTHTPVNNETQRGTEICNTNEKGRQKERER